MLRDLLAFSKVTLGSKFRSAKSPTVFGRVQEAVGVGMPKASSGYADIENAASWFVVLARKRGNARG